MKSVSGMKNPFSSSRAAKAVSKKLEEENKKKAEEEHTKQVFQEFVATFDGDPKRRSWIKGGVVQHGPTGSSNVTPTGSRIYAPVSKIEEKHLKSESKLETKKSSEKPPALGKRRGQEQKKSKLEQFKEELKLIQEQREQRHAFKQGKTGPVPDAVYSELDLSDVSGRGRDNRSLTSGLSMHNNYGAGLLGAAANSFMSKRGGQRDRRDDYPYDFDVDRTTTNLFLGNLNPKMTEQQLCAAFGRYGPLASVKIMWPRTDEERSRGRNCGFVAFMNRQDGERALDNIKGKELMGFEMKLGWGKNVPIPLYPIYIPPALMELIKSPPPSGLPFNAQPREWLKSLRLAIKERAKLVTDGNDLDTPLPPGPERKPFDVKNMSKDELNDVLKDSVVKVVIPIDRSILALIHRMIEFVVLEGPHFEAAIMHREQNNPQFRFLFDYQFSEHTYYRWKLWSILHGESVNNWRTDEFRMLKGGPLWRPPPMNLFSGGMPEDLVEEDEYPYASGYVPTPQSRRRDDSDGMFDEAFSDAMAASRRCGLTEAQKGRFIQMLGELEPTRKSIADLMVWCLEHADSASDIADCIVESFSPEFEIQTGNSTQDAADNEEPKAKVSTLTQFLARLFLISDILYNSSAKVPNASYFRKCFESRLFEVFKRLHLHHKNVEGKLKVEQMKQKVMICFRAWEDWAVYPNEYLIKLQNVFLGLVIESEDEADLAGVPLDVDQCEGVEKLTTLGADVEALDWKPLVQYDGDPLDVDGSPLDADSVIDKPSVSQSKVPSKLSPKLSAVRSTDRLFVPSKWETVDPGSVESDAVTTSNRWELLVDSDRKEDSPKRQQQYANSGRWKTFSDSPDDDVDGQPLATFGGLVAYDDEDALSPVSDSSDIPLPKSPAPTLGDSAHLFAPTPSSLSILTEERRSQLREIESKVLKYQDELEASRKGDRSITDDAINKQVQRYRERLLERLDEDISSPYLIKKQSAVSNSKTAKHRKDRDCAAPPSKVTRRDHSISPPASRGSRDRSPPRSLRDRYHTRRPPPSPDSREGSDTSGTTSSKPNEPFNDVLDSREGGWGDDLSTNAPRARNRQNEELEEGEASDEEDSGSAYPQQVSAAGHKHRDYDQHLSSPKHSRKRHRVRTPDDKSRHKHHSRSQSPSRRRVDTVSTNAGSKHKRK